MPLFHKHLAAGDALELRLGGADTVAALFVHQVGADRVRLQVVTPLNYRSVAAGRESLDLTIDNGDLARVGDCFQIVAEDPHAPPLFAQLVVVRISAGRVALSIDAPPLWRCEITSLPLVPGV